MDYKEKYEQALERMKIWMSEDTPDEFFDNHEVHTFVFPELAESEDDRIREAIVATIHLYYGEPLEDEAKEMIAWLEKQKTSEEALQYLKENHSPSEVSDFQAAMNIAVAKAYDKGIKDGLEKQSEQKSTDKVEPKFHEGDWIIHQGTENIYQVVAVIDNQYQLKYGDNYTVQKCADVDRCARLWDITKDAKDGYSLTSW